MMEFNEKIQQLRKQRGLTQEQLAQALYVSRTAVSKWESGRGYPNIDSLKAIARFFDVTVDELLSGDAQCTIARAEGGQTENRFRDMLFGLIDCSAAGFFFLPLLGRRAEGTAHTASLLTLTDAAPYLKASYFIVVAGMVAAGIMRLAMQKCRMPAWMQYQGKMSLALNAAGVLLFIISLQPYAAMLMFVLLMIKLLIPAKQR